MIVNRKSLGWPGMRSTLPPSWGTQKLWMTSADVRRISIGRADREMELVGDVDRGARIAHVPPPLVADDLHVQRGAARLA